MYSFVRYDRSRMTIGGSSHRCDADMRDRGGSSLRVLEPHLFLRPTDQDAVLRGSANGHRFAVVRPFYLLGQSLPLGVHHLSQATSEP